MHLCVKHIPLVSTSCISGVEEIDHPQLQTSLWVPFSSWPRTAHECVKNSRCYEPDKPCCKHKSCCLRPFCVKELWSLLLIPQTQLDAESCWTGETRSKLFLHSLGALGLKQHRLGGLGLVGLQRLFCSVLKSSQPVNMSAISKQNWCLSSEHAVRECMWPVVGVYCILQNKVFYKIMR